MNQASLFFVRGFGQFRGDRGLPLHDTAFLPGRRVIPFVVVVTFVGAQLLGAIIGRDRASQL